jgi:hypothetical protein
MDIVSASSLKNLEVRLAMAIDACVQAETDLNALRLKAGLPESPKQFYLGHEFRLGVAEARAEAASEAKAVKADRPPPAYDDRGRALRRIDRNADDGSEWMRNVRALVHAAHATVCHPELTADDFPDMLHVLVSYADHYQPTRLRLRSSRPARRRETDRCRLGTQSRYDAA